MEDILEGSNRVFLKAGSGKEALSTLLKHDDIGLILMDVQMPGMDGFEVTELLKSNVHTKDISIIFVTAINKEEQYVNRGFQNGAVDYLFLPLDVDIARAKVKVFEQLYFYQLGLKETIERKERINKKLEQFMYLVAHDIKSPLIGIHGVLKIFSTDPRLAAQQDLRELATLMNEAFGDVIDMVDSILEYTVQSESDQTLEVVEVKELVRQIVNRLFAPSNIRIKIDGDLPTITTKRIRLEQVFQNLISNAIKYNDNPEGEIIIGCIDEQDFYKFYVKDNGPGILAQDQKDIFKLFRTTENRPNNSEKSTGVGLNIFKMFVEEQGGKISLESIPGKGSCFYFQWRK